MAITVKIAATKSAVSGAATEFTATGPFVLYGDGFGVHEHAKLLRLGPSGAQHPLTNEREQVKVSAYPNTVIVGFPGTFRIDKMATNETASVGYELIEEVAAG